MTVPISPDRLSFVQAMISSGTFQNEEAVVNAAIDLLKKQQHDEEAIRRQLAPAIARLDRGEGVELEESQLDAFFADITADEG